MSGQLIHGSSKKVVAGAVATAAGRAVVYLWAGPMTVIGLVATLATLVTGGRSRIVDGVIETEGGLARFILARCTPLRGGASAMTLGHVVIGRDAHLLAATRAHERVHVRQCERWGPLFLPAYFTASLLTWARGRRPYMDNPFEREAYARG